MSLYLTSVVNSILENVEQEKRCRARIDAFMPQLWDAIRAAVMDVRQQLIHKETDQHLISCHADADKRVLVVSVCGQSATLIRREEVVEVNVDGSLPLVASVVAVYTGDQRGHLDQPDHLFNQRQAYVYLTDPSYESQLLVHFVRREHAPISPMATEDFVWKLLYLLSKTRSLIEI